MNKTPRPVRPTLLRIVLGLGVAALPACAELDHWASRDDYLGPFRHLEPLPPGYSSGKPAEPATQPATTEPSFYAATQPSFTQPAQPLAPIGPLDLTVQNALLSALENNPELRIQRLNPAIARTGEEQARAAFDPDLAGSFAAGRQRVARPGSPPSSSDSVDADVNVTEFLPTGTTVNVDAATSALFNDSSGNTRVGASITQALLRGAGVNVNLASLRQARLDVLASQYELRGFAESLMEQVENTYWDYALAQRQMDIVTESLNVAQQQFNETRDFIDAGKLAGTERVAAEAEVALRQEAVIDARSTLDTTRLRLLQLLNPRGGPYWDRAINLENQPFVPLGVLDPVETHIQVAMRLRADLNQAKLQVQRGDLELVKTRNGLLPKLDLFITLGKTGYAKVFDRSVDDLFTRPSFDAAAGVRFEYPIANRSARASNTRAMLSRDQAAEAVNNLEQTVEVDVRSAYIEVMRTRQQITATAASRRLQEEKNRAEVEKLRQGKSTSLLVAQTERDLLAARIAEIQAVVANLKATVTLFRLEGSLLERRGISAPASEPVGG